MVMELDKGEFLCKIVEDLPSQQYRSEMDKEEWYGWFEEVYDEGYKQGSKYITVAEQEPPHNTELLVKSPTGVVHLANWRPAYNIFTCQNKSESSWDWSWKLI